MYKSHIHADLGTYGEDVDLLDEVGLVGNHELEKSNQGRPEVSPIVRYPHPATQMEGYYFFENVDWAVISLFKMDSKKFDKLLTAVLMSYFKFYS